LESKPDALILADWWGVGNQERNDVRQYDNIIRMCEMANAAKTAEVATVLGVGSQAELGPVSNVITENLPDQPTTKYGFAKAEARLKLHNIFKKNYGPHSKWNMMLLGVSIKKRKELKKRFVVLMQEQEILPKLEDFI
jgi:hypothetical protein